MNRRYFTFYVLFTLLLISCQHKAQVENQVSATENLDNNIEYQIMVQRATQVAIWAMPAVGIIDFEKAVKRDVNANTNDIIYFSKPLDSRHGFLTANDVTNYTTGFFNCEKEPLVVEVPPAGEKVSYFGTFVNAWDQPIEDVGPPGADKGEGGKYLLVPPGYNGDLPEEGFIIRQVDTYDMCIAFRPVLKNEGTYQDAADYAKLMKVYYLSEAANPPSTKSYDAYPTNFDCLPYYDFTFWQDINDVIQSNPVRVQDKVMVNLLKSLGIDKGKELNPTPTQKKAMLEGLQLAYDYMQDYFVTEGKACVPLWKGKNQWQVWNFAKGQPEAGFPYETEQEVLVDSRSGGSYFWITFLPKYLGGGTFYLTGLRDKSGELLNGQDTYKLNVPANTPAKDFWSVIVYSMKTKGFVRNAERVGLATPNTKDMISNEDGSWDVYFAPTPPEGKESNWIPTGEDFFLLFRLYGPESKVFYKTWMLRDIEKVN